MSTPPLTGPDDLAFPARRPDDPISVDLDAELHVSKMAAEFAGDAPELVHYRQWDIEQRIGSGAMGVVYLARHRELGRRVALKILKPTSEDENVSMARFIREARALARIRHDNVLQIYQVDTSGTRAVIEMEYLEGPTLRAWQSTPGRSWRAIVAAYASVGDGLAALHRAELLHRDIKPDNLLMDANGRPKIVDLGLAVGIRRTQSDGPAEHREVAALTVPLTVEGTLVGTPGYMAPEVLASSEATAASDQFSLATSLYEAIYGVRPFTAKTPEGYAAAFGNRVLTKPRDRRRRPRWLLRSLQRALSFEPAQRFPTVEDFVATLRSGLLRRRRFLVIVTTGLSFLGIAAGAWYLKPPQQDACADVGAEITEILNVTTRNKLSSRARASGRPEVEGSLAVLLDTLDKSTRAWSDGSTLLCLAKRQHRPPATAEWSAEAHLDERQEECLEHTRRRIKIVTETLQDISQNASRDIPAYDLVRRFTDAASLIEALPSCNNRRALSTWPRTAADPELDHALDAALTAEFEGTYGKAEDLARKVVERTRTGEPLLHAEALFRLGHILGLQRQPARARELLSEARNTAIALGHDVLLCRIVAFQAKLSASLERNPTSAKDELGLAQACARGVRTRSPILLGDLWDAAGLAARASGAFEEAIELHRKAVEVRREHLGDDHPETMRSLQNLAIALGYVDKPGYSEEARDLYQQCLEARTRLFGKDHPEVADILFNLGDDFRRRGESDQARESLEKALAIYSKADSNSGSFSVIRRRTHLLLAAVAIEMASTSEDASKKKSSFDEAASHLDQFERLSKGNEDGSPEIDRAQYLHLSGLLALQRAGAMPHVSGKLTVASRLVFRNAADYLRQAAKLYSHVDRDAEASDCIVNEIEAQYALEEFARMAEIVRDDDARLVNYIRSLLPLEERGKVAWYLGEALHKVQSDTDAEIYIHIALKAYEDLNDRDSVRELHALLRKIHPQESSAL